MKKKIIIFLIILNISNISNATIKDEIIEDNDAYLNKKDKTSQVIPKIRKNLYESANITPR